MLPGRVSVNFENFNFIFQLRVSLVKNVLSGFIHRHKTIWEITCSVATAWRFCPFELFFVYVIFCVRKSRISLAVFVKVYRAANVIEMQMRNYYVGYIFRFYAYFCERIVKRTALMLDSENIRKFLLPANSGSGINNYFTIFIFNKKNASGQSNSVFFVGGICSFPKFFRNNAEHCAAVYSESSRFKSGYVKFPDFHFRLQSFKKAF